MTKHSNKDEDKYNNTKKKQKIKKNKKQKQNEKRPKKIIKEGKGRDKILTIREKQ